MKIYCKRPVNCRVGQAKKNQGRLSICDNRSGETMQLAKKISVAQLAYNYQGLVTLTKPNIRPLAAARQNEGEFNSTGMQHNYAYEKGNATNLARSAGNRHSEPLLVMRKIPQITMNIISERRPCPNCEEDLGDAAAIMGATINAKSLIAATAAGNSTLENKYMSVWHDVSANTNLA